MKALSIDIQEKVYSNGTVALQALRFSAQAGEFLALVGPSGAGKSTLLNLIAGLEELEQGQIQLDEQAVDRSAWRLGFLFQESRLLPWLTVEENIHLVLRGQAQGADAASLARAHALLERVGLQAFRKAYPRQLSGGMQRRVALVRAFVVQPELLLMDEPFQSLDEPNAEQLRTLLLELWAETGATVLFVTHSLREALALADRVLFLSARPAHIILDQVVDLPRPRALDSLELATLQASLLTQHPQLLSGVCTDATLTGPAP